MHTGYDNYWMFNRQETVPNLPRNGNLSDYMSLNSYTHNLDGRQTCHLNNFLPTQNMTSQGILSYSQKTSQYDWTSIAPQSSISYNYQTTGVHMQQKDSTVHWKNFEPRHLDGRNSVAPSLNYYNNNNNMLPNTQLLENQYNRPTTQTPRIRVRDVNSLNKIAQNSVSTNCTEERQFDKNLNGGYNVNQTQQDPAQKNNVDHAKSIPSLIEVNPFQPLLQKQPAAPKPSVHQDWFPNTYSKSREQVLPSSQYQLNNIRRKEPPYGTSHSFLQEMLGGVNQMDAPRSEHPQNGQAMNCRSNVPRSHGTKNCDLSLSKLLELNCNQCQPSYQNPPPYSKSLQRTSLPPVSQGNNLPIIEPISPPVVKNNESGESSIRVTAVISLPEWCGRRVFKKISMTSNENLNSTPAAESAKENENQNGNPEVPNNDVPNAVPIDSPSDCLKVKEEPKFSLEFSQDNTTDIVIQTMKTENFGEEVEGESQNSEQQTSDKNASAAASAATTSTTGDGDNENKNNSNNNNNNNEEKTQNLDTSKNDSIDETPTGKVTVREAADSRGEDSLRTSEIKLEVREPNYKSKINRDKLDMLIEFINGSDKRADYAGENYSEKFKKQRKVKGSTNVKANKSSSEKSKKSVKDTLPKISSTVARAEVTKRSSPQLLTTKSDSAKKGQIETKKEEQNPVLKNQSKEAVNTDKAKPNNDNKNQNPTSNVLWQSKEVQNNRPKNKTSKKNIPEKTQKIGNKSDSTEDQAQVIVTVKTEHSGKTKKLDSSAPKIDADVTRSEKCSEVRNCLQGNQEEVGYFRTCDINQNEKPKSKPATEVIEGKLKGLPDLISLVKEEELQNLQPQTVVEKYKSTRIFANLKYQFCENCVTISPTECFWMNVISGEVKCSNCFKNTNWDSTEATHKLFSDEKNLETKTNKNGCAEKFHSPDRKNATSKNLENHIDQKVIHVIPRESSDGKKSQRRHSTGKEEFRREKRKSLADNLFGERKEKRRKSEEKYGKKAQEQISETSSERPKMHGVLECSKTEKSTRKSLSKDRSQSPKKEERPRKNSTDQIRKSVKDEDLSSKAVRKAESNSEAGKNQTNSEDLWPRKLQVIEEVNEYCADKYSRKSIELLKTVQQVEKEKTKDFQTAEVGGRNHAEFKKTSSKKTSFSRSTDLLKENQCTKVRSASCEKVQDRRKKREKSTKEHGERKKRSIKGPLHYKDFVYKKLPVFYFPDAKKPVPLTEVL